MAEESGRGESEMNRLLRFILGAALITSVFGFGALANLYAQRRPAAAQGPSVTWKAPTEGQPGDYAGADACETCHPDA